MLDSKPALAQRSMNTARKDDSTFLLIVISMEIHASRLSIIPCVAIPKEVVEEPSNDEIGACSVYSPAIVPCTDVGLCIAMNLDYGIVYRCLLHLGVRESILHMRAVRT